MEESPKKTVKDRLFGLVKIFAFIVVIGLILLTVLVNMGGQSDIYKNTIEDYVSERTGLHAQIGKFNSMTFFPALALDFENLELKVNPEDSILAARLGRVQLAFDFWDVFLSTGEVRYVNIEDGYAIAGLFSPREITLERIAVHEDPAGGVFFRGRGTVGGDPVSLQVNLESFGTGKDRSFRFPPAKDISFSIGPALLVGTLDDSHDMVALKNVHLDFEGSEILRADLLMKRAPGDEVNLTGAVSFAAHGSVLKPALTIREKSGSTVIAGDIRSPGVESADLDGNSRFVAALHYLAGLFEDSPPGIIEVPLFFREGDLKLDFERLDDRATFTMDIEIRNEKLLVHPGAALSETYTLAPVTVLP